MKRAVILSAVPLSVEMKRYLKPGDFVVACDAGYRNAAALGVTPNLIVGDFDSAPKPQTTAQTIVLPHIKDDSDTHYAARWLLEHGYEEIVMLGALGGARLEHTLANLSTGLYLAQNGVKVILANAQSELHYLVPNSPLTLERGDWHYLSLFAMSESLEGVWMAGVFYPLENAALAQSSPLGVSNEFTAPQATLHCSAGYGLIVLTRAEQ